jgi:DNA-binding MarR family transcriptional regulator
MTFRLNKEKDNACKNAGISMTKQERFVKAMATSGNLFLLITLPELRRQGMTYLSLYGLQRTVEIANRGSANRFSEYWLRSETGLADYETSRACSLLEKSGLVKVSKDAEDGRVRLLTPTPRGRRVLDKILSTAANRLWDGIQHPGRIRRMTEATEALRRANRILLGPLQLSFFDKDLFPKEPRRNRSKKQPAARPDKARSKDSKSGGTSGKGKKRVSLYEQIYG